MTEWFHANGCCMSVPSDHSQRIHHCGTIRQKFHEKSEASLLLLTILSVVKILIEFSRSVLSWIGTNSTIPNTGIGTIFPVKVVFRVGTPQKQQDQTKHTHTNPWLRWGQNTVAWVHLQWGQIPTDPCSDQSDLNRDVCTLTTISHVISRLCQSYSDLRQTFRIG